VTRSPVLQLREIQKRFPGVHALRGVSLEVDAGEIVALLGENGAGKSTLMNIVGGVQQPDSGEILVDGGGVVMRDVHTATALGIGFIHQELNLLDNLDVAGNVLLGREPTRWGALRMIDRSKMREHVRPYLDQLGVGIPPDTPMAALSIARQQLVEIAKALSLNARLLIMDEPTSSLTLAETARLHEIVASLRERGVAIIYITHRLGEVRTVADRAVVLRDGANAGALAREELTHDNMIRLMVGREIEDGTASERASEPRDRSEAAKRRARARAGEFEGRSPSTELMVGREIAVEAGTVNANSGRDYFRVDALRTRRYPAHEVSFAVRRGEILGVAGLVGAGRSEIARAVFGVEPPIAGTISLDGSALHIREPEDAIRHGVFLVPEDRRVAGLVVDFSVRENVSLPALGRFARHALVSGRRERQAVAAVCGQLQVKAASIEVKATTLSGGNQQKVVLAKWLALGPKVLMVDEPTRGIDVGAKAEIYRLLRGLARGGVAIVMISSDMEEILHVSDRIAVMHEGRITGLLERADCTEERVMRLAVGQQP
jgi:ribose transport system ATP-binding protein